MHAAGVAVFAVALILPSDSSAHGGDLGELWLTGPAWTSDLRVIAPLYISAILFLVGTVRLWRRAGHERLLTGSLVSPERPSLVDCGPSAYGQDTEKADVVATPASDPTETSA